MATQLRGVMKRTPDPFNSEQMLDKESLRRLVRFNIEQGIDGLYVGGSTGEAFVQSLSEREQVMEIVAEEAKGKITLIAHVGCVSTAESQQLAILPPASVLTLYPPSHRFTIPLALKNIATTIVQLLTPRRGCRWWFITSLR